HRDLEPDEAGLGHPLHGPDGGVEGTDAPYRVVDVGGGAVEGDLHVHVVARCQSIGHRGGDSRSIGGDLPPDVVVGRIVDQLPEVAADGGLAASDVDVEDLH